MRAEDLLVFYTDGLIEEEGQDGEIFSRERLAETIVTLQALPPKELLANDPRRNPPVCRPPGIL